MYRSTIFFQKNQISKFLFVVLFAASPSFAGQSTYFCSISNAYELDGKGSLGVWSSMVSHLQQERFSVDRGTGLITSEFHTNTAPHVIWNPTQGDGNNYLVVDRAKSERAGFTSSLVVKEIDDSDRKPFLWQWGSNVITGFCE